jgi:hypothetical protein
MSDLQKIGMAFALLRQDGWIARGDYACCMTCAKAELIPEANRGVSSAWYTQNDSRDTVAGNIVDNGLTSRSFLVSVLGDVEPVAARLRERFGDRVVQVSPATAERIGHVRIEPEGMRENSDGFREAEEVVREPLMRER